MMRAFACAVALLVPSSAATPTTGLPQYPQVRQVVCSEGKGTAFLTDHGWLSVAHVTTLTHCQIDGQDIEGNSEGDLDFSTVKVALPGKGLRINCGGFRPGHWYFAVGYAGGADWQTMTRQLAIYKQTEDGMRYLYGYPTVIPGMSGGPIFNDEGEVVGTVNRYNRDYPFSYSRELKDTSVCRAA